MKKIICMALVVLASAPALAQSQTHVRGYTRSDGTYVQPHYRTAPNTTRNDNWTTQGNVNPYTGQEGARPRDNGYNGYNGYKPNYPTPRQGTGYPSYPRYGTSSGN